MYETFHTLVLLNDNPLSTFVEQQRTFNQHDNLFIYTSVPC